MTTRSGRGRWQRVLDARRQARAGLGGAPRGGDMYGSPPKPNKAPSRPPEPTPVRGAQAFASCRSARPPCDLAWRETNSRR